MRAHRCGQGLCGRAAGADEVRQVGGDPRAEQDHGLDAAAHRHRGRPLRGRQDAHGQRRIGLGREQGDETHHIMCVIVIINVIHPVLLYLELRAYSI